MDDRAVPLPVSGSALRADPRLAEAVRRISVSRGADCFDDAAVGRMLHEHRLIVRRKERGAGTGQRAGTRRRGDLDRRTTAAR